MKNHRYYVEFVPAEGIAEARTQVKGLLVKTARESRVVRDCMVACVLTSTVGIEESQFSGLISVDYCEESCIRISKKEANRLVPGFSSKVKALEKEQKEV